MDDDKRMVWTGRCDRCDALVALWPSDETDPAEQELTSSQWPEAGGCYVQECDGDIEWNGNDPIAAVITVGRR
jgi:hypothetical protein